LRGERGRQGGRKGEGVREREKNKNINMRPAIIDLDLCCPTSAFLHYHPHMYMTESGEKYDRDTERQRERETGRPDPLFNCRFLTRLRQKAARSMRFTDTLDLPATAGALLVRDGKRREV
jgi:hypothetical protein